MSILIVISTLNELFAILIYCYSHVNNKSLFIFYISYYPCYIYVYSPLSFIISNTFIFELIYFRTKFRTAIDFIVTVTGVLTKSRLSILKTDFPVFRLFRF